MRTPERTTEWKKNHFPQLVGRGGWRLEGLDGPPVAGEFTDCERVPLRVRTSSPSGNVARDHRGFSPPHPEGNPEKEDLLRVPFWEWRTILELSPLD